MQHLCCSVRTWRVGILCEGTKDQSSEVQGKASLITYAYYIFVAIGEVPLQQCNIHNKNQTADVSQKYLQQCLLFHTGSAGIPGYDGEYMPASRQNEGASTSALYDLHDYNSDTRSVN